MKLIEPIVGQLVTLRTAEEKDAEYTLQIRSDSEKTKYLTQFEGTKESQIAWIKSEIESPDDCFCIVEDKAGRPIGTYGFEAYDPIAKTAVTSHALLFGTPMHNSEAMFLLHKYLFEVLSIEDAVTYILEENKASRGVIFRFGGKEVSREYDSSHHMDLVRIDILRDDFNRANEKFINLVNRFAGRM